VVVSELEFSIRADHPSRHHASNLGAFENGAIGKRRSHRRKGDILARGDVRRATDHFDRLSIADIHPANRKSIRIRMLSALEDPSHSNRREIGPRRVDLDILEPTECEPLDEVGFCGEIDELPEPFKRYAHQICSNTRRSPSKSSRILGIP